MIQKLITIVGKMSSGQFVGVTFGAMCLVVVATYTVVMSPLPILSLILVVIGWVLPVFAFLLRWKSYDQKDERK